MIDYEVLQKIIRTHNRDSYKTHFYCCRCHLWIAQDFYKDKNKPPHCVYCGARLRTRPR